MPASILSETPNQKKKENSAGIVIAGREISAGIVIAGCIVFLAVVFSLWFLGEAAASKAKKPTAIHLTPPSMGQLVDNAVQPSPIVRYLS